MNSWLNQKEKSEPRILSKEVTPSIDLDLKMLADLIIDSFLLSRRKAGHTKSVCYTEKELKPTEGIFSGRLGQTPSGLSSPRRPLKL